MDPLEMLQGGAPLDPMMPDESMLDPEQQMLLDEAKAKMEAEAEEKKRKTLDFCHKKVAYIQRHDKPNVISDIQEAMDYYFADHSIVKSGKGRSKYTTTDLADVVEWCLPSLMKIFASGADVVDFQPQNPDDDEATENVKDLINYQLKRKNPWFLICNDVIRDVLMLRLGVLKYQWYRRMETIEKEYDAMPDQVFQMEMAKGATVVSDEQVPMAIPPEMQMQMQQMQMQAAQTGMQLPPPPMVHNCTLSYQLEDEYFKVEAVPLEELGFPTDMKSVKDCEFMYHEFRHSKHDMIDEFGADLVDQIDESLGDHSTSYDGSQNTSASDADIKAAFASRFQDIQVDFSSFTYDKESSKYIGYECWYRNPDTGIPWMTIFCGDVILYDGINKYKKAPVEVGTAVKMSHRALGRSLKDLMKDLMKIRTALMRQVLDNTFFNNNGRYVVDPSRMTLDDFMNNNYPGGIVRGDPSAFATITPAPMQPWVFNVMEMFQQEKDYHGGVPRSFQGVNSDVMNDTFRGQTQQVNLAQQRIEMIARLLAEQLFAPLIEDAMYCNMRFLKDKTAIRVLGKWKTITPDTITTKADLIVNVGIGNGNKDQIVMYMQQLLGIYGQVKQAGVPVVSAENVYNAIKELVKAMGFRNTDDFTSDPQIGQLIVQLGQVVMQHTMALMQTGMPPDMMLVQSVDQLAVMFGLPPITPQLQQMMAPPPGIQAAGGVPGGGAGPSGGQPPRHGMAGNGKFPGQEPPALPVQPVQPRQVTRPSQGGHFG